MDNFSNLMMIGECLLDVKRVHAFERAIRKVVKKGDVVLDGGTGSGIMALLAAEAGAGKVYAVELDPDISSFAKSNISKNGKSGVVEVLNKDMKGVNLPEVDVVIMEMMDTGLIAEQQVPAINNLVEKGIIGKHTQVIPNKFETYIQFSNYDFNFYGFDMPFIVQARNFGVIQKIQNRFSPKVKINEVDLTRYNSVDFSMEGDVTFSNVGIINSLVITSKIRLASGVLCPGTSDLNMPVIVPVESLEVHEGESKKFRIAYKYGYGFNTLKFEWLM